MRHIGAHHKAHSPSIAARSDGGMAGILFVDGPECGANSLFAPHSGPLRWRSSSRRDIGQIRYLRLDVTLCNSSHSIRTIQQTMLEPILRMNRPAIDQETPHV